jgi:hypothetical protein
MRRNSKNRSNGEMISSVTFFGFAIWLFLEAQGRVGLISDSRVFGLYVSSAFCLLGSLRFILASGIAYLLRSRRD